MLKTATSLFPVLALVLFAGSCSGVNVPLARPALASGYHSGYDPQGPRLEQTRLSAALETAPAVRAGDFEVIVLDANNQPDPAGASNLELTATADELTLTMRRPVPSATAYIRFDPAQQHPGEFGTARADGVSLALRVSPGLLAVGASAYGDGDLDPSQPLAVVSFLPGPDRNVQREASISQNQANIIRATNLTAVDNVNSTATLQWLEFNTGDYDVNSEVNIADLTPIGAKFKRTYVLTDTDYAILEVVDGDRNGEINLADITPIGANFQSAISGYDVYRTTLATPDEIPLVTDTGRWTKVPNDTEPAGPSAPRVANGQLVRQQYTFIDASGEGDFGWYVQPVGGTGDGKPAAGPKGEAVTLHVSPDGPPPAGLSFEIMTPATDVVAVDDEFYLAVKVTDITDLFSANVRFEYDSTLVQYIEGVPAYDTNVNFLEPPLFVDADDVDEAADPYTLIGFNATQTQGTPAKTGSGYLAFIKFKALAAGANATAFRFPQATNFIYLWGEQYGVPIASPTLGSPQTLEVQ